MRPARLQVEGFMSFRDETIVDFNDADLFALTGPTGSGKTSVLDAIVFALYGNVPRLADQRSVAPVIAQGMAEAHVRLDFTIGDEPFTATRIVRRTKAGGGTTAEARLEANGEVVAGNADDVTTAVTERLGLTYDHFTKCVMLPQGEFARFLHDKPATRQDLLISLLDLGVYEQMADLAGRRASAAKSEAAVLEGRLADVAAATPEAIAGAAARVAQLTTLVAELDAAGPALLALEADVETATADAARAAEEAALLADIVVPKGIDKLHDRAAAAVKRLDELTATVAAAEEAVATAERALAAAGDRAELTRWLDAHERAAGLGERRVKADVVVVERRADVVAASAVLAAADARCVAARSDEDDIAAAHRAHAVRADLVEGQACPVCLQVVGSIPKVKAPAALAKARTERDKAEREQRAANETHGAATRALALAEQKLVDIEADIADVAKLLKKAPSPDDVRVQLDAQAQATGAVVVSRAAVAEARGTHAAAVAECNTSADAERAARETYDEARDAVAALKPPARTRSASLLAEWTALAEWAAAEHKARMKQVHALETNLETLAAQRTERLTALAQLCLEADLALSTGVEPIAAAREALGRAGAKHETLVARAADAIRLQGELQEVEARGAVARGLATHLDARHFEKWLLDEAMVALADGATEMLMALSGDQYSLRVDAKNGTFVVVDHRNADEVRGARTLSGGETFLASLALALALADRITSLAARGAARLESIFLDEGFGTLDPDTLDVVASAIEELGATGRMVGIVSHVAELAERLPVRYEVRRSGNASAVERIDR